MKRGFTLLELIIVIVIIGILATLGFTQYARMMERSRGAEAKMVIGSIRTVAAGYYLEKGNISGVDFTTFGIGNTTADPSKIPGPGLDNCSSANYFVYNITSTASTLTATAIRCNSTAGKAPPGDSSNTLQLQADFSSGSDTWSGAY